MQVFSALIVVIAGAFVITIIYRSAGPPPNTPANVRDAGRRGAGAGCRQPEGPSSCPGAPKEAPQQLRSSDLVRILLAPVCPREGVGIPARGVCRCLLCAVSHGADVLQIRSSPLVSVVGTQAHGS